MTLDISTDRTSGAQWWPRSEAEVTRDQVAGIDAWHTARRTRELSERAAEAAAGSREARLDLARRTDVVRRQQQAIIERTEQHMHRSAQLLRSGGPLRAVVAHRNDWFKGKVIDGLASYGIEVIARLDNGADAVGCTVAEQPDLLLVEDKLAMVSGADVIRQVREFARHTISAAQVEFEDTVTAMLDAGARTAFTRRVPPTEVARELAGFVRA